MLSIHNAAHNLAIHDGEAAGQPVLLPHVHVHVVPRSNGDLEKNDAIYDMLGAWSPEGAPTIPPPFYVPSDEERKVMFNQTAQTASEQGGA